MRKTRSGAPTPPHMKDLLIEAAVSTIIDCEDSVAAVDAGDKVQLYRKLDGLDGKATSRKKSRKGGKNFTRRLNEDRSYRKAGGRGRW